MPTRSALSRGDRVEVAMTKWGGLPHWGFAGVYLGDDDLGEWVGVPAGTRHSRPGAAFVSGVDTVTLVPRAAAYLATLHAPGIWCEIYVDVATPAAWDGAVLRSTDLDLDVVRLPDGTVYVDDEDEFAEHRVSLGYPTEVVRLAEDSCASVHAAVLAGQAPYDAASAQRWLSDLRGLLGPGRGEGA